MKKLITFLIAGALTGVVYAEAEMKEVCHDKKDSKGNVVKKADGTVVKECKKIKVHKKLEGTKVEDAKKSDKK